MANFNSIKQTRFGKMIFNTSDQYIGRSIDAYGEFSYGEVVLFQQLVQPGMTVLDIGANIGAHTLFFSQTVGLEGVVHAFEPQRILFQTLCGNMAINSVINVDCHQVALGNTQGEVTIPFFDYTKEYNYGGVSLGHWSDGEKVPLIKLDDLELKACHFIKMDVEGMEQEALAGGEKTIQSYRPIMYVENDRKEKSDDLVRYIDSLNYIMYWHIPYLFNPENFEKNPENIFGNVASFNMICIPKELNAQVNDASVVEVPE